MLIKDIIPIRDIIDKKHKPQYGYYYFKPYMLMLLFFVISGCSFLFLGIIMKKPLMTGGALFIIFYGIFTTLGWILARYVIPGNRIKIAKDIVHSLNISGKEMILDVGSGRGLYAIEVAKKLSTGKVIGIDIWDEAEIDNLIFHHRLSQPTGNIIKNARKNAVIEGVDNKIEFISMDANHLKFASNSFDVVICGFVIGHLWKFSPAILKEIYRVLKPGGRLIIIDSVRDLTYLLLSTPHLFILSYLKGTKARWLTKQNWYSLIMNAGFKISRFKARRSIISVEGQV
jgi:ubiquinone/menaquinone biosynthesis C-methylase UbiE